MGAPGSFGTAAHPSQNILPSESILEAAFSLYSWQQPENQGQFHESMNPPTGNNSQRTNVFPDTTGKSDTSQGQKGITRGTLSCWVFLHLRAPQRAGMTENSQTRAPDPIKFHFLLDFSAAIQVKLCQGSHP